MEYVVKDMNTDKILFSSRYNEEIKDFVSDLKIGTYYTDTLIRCKGNNCDSTETQERFDFHGIHTGWYCNNCYDNNYPYRKEDYTNGTGIADDGTPIENNY